MRKLSRIVPAAIVVLLVLLGGPTARGAFFRTFVTGDDPIGDVIFDVTLDPAIAGSATFGVAVRDTIRMDGIDYVAGSGRKVAVGAQVLGGGAIRQYDVFSGAILPAFEPTTGVPSQPSTILPTATHAYYVENQFGFAGATHRIMRTPFAGPSGAPGVVFDGAAAGAGGLVNFEGLEIVGGRLYFFAEDTPPGVPTDRALYSNGLAGGVWDGVAPVRHLGGLAEGPGSTDGSDELDFDPTSGPSGLLFGTNVINGEVVWWDPVAATGGFLISPSDISSAPPLSGLARMGGAELDGIRPTGNGYLVLTGIDGVILSIDIAGAFAGVDVGDVNILYDRLVDPGDLRFDDLTPMNAVPEPATLALVGLGLAALARRRRKR